jgi:hypothetical protein
MDKDMVNFASVIVRGTPVLTWKIDLHRSAIEITWMATRVSVITVGNCGWI